MKPWAVGAIGIGGAVIGALAMRALVPGAVQDAAPPETEEAATPGSTNELNVSAQVQAEAGIRVAAVQAASEAAIRGGYAHALDLSPLARLAADAEAVRAAAAASRKEVDRLAALAAQDQGASQKELEAARVQLAADQAKLTLACQQVGLDYGAGLASLGCEAIPALARQAAQGRAALLRVDMPDGAPPAGAHVTVGQGRDSVVARILGPAASADPQLQAPGVLALVEGGKASALSVGRVLPVNVAVGAAVSGVFVPRGAILRADGGSFVYRVQGASHFARVALGEGTPRDDVWFFANSPLKPGDRIVVSGAVTLLGLERGPQDQGGD